MTGLCYEDLEIGHRVESMARTIHDSEIVAFNNLTWMINPIHSDRGSAEQSAFGGLVVPAPFILGILLGLLSTTGYLSGTAVAVLEYESLKFLHPVRPGDTVRAIATVVRRRETSHSGRGLVEFGIAMRNQEDVAVFEGVRKVLVRRRSEG